MIRYMANFTALVKKYPTEYFCTAMVAGIFLSSECFLLFGTWIPTTLVYINSLSPPPLPPSLSLPLPSPCLPPDLEAKWGLVQ
jgi:hypothetical protein